MQKHPSLIHSARSKWFYILGVCDIYNRPPPEMIKGKISKLVILVNCRFSGLLLCQMFKLVLEKAEEPEVRLPTSAGSSKKQESSRKTSISALLTMLKPLTAWITINCGKFWKRWEHQTTFPASWETCMQVRKQQLELDMEQQTGSK